MMNTLQRWILIIGLALIAMNLLYPRDWHGPQYHFYTTVRVYDVTEMVMRLFVLLVLLISIVLWVGTVSRPNQGLRRAILLLGTWAVIKMLLCPIDNELFCASGNYFSELWYSPMVDLEFLLSFWIAITAVMYLLFAMLRYPLTTQEKKIVWWIFAGNFIIQFIAGFGETESAYIHTDVLIVSAIATIVSYLVMLIRLAYRQHRDMQANVPLLHPEDTAATTAPSDDAPYLGG